MTGLLTPLLLLVSSAALAQDGSRPTAVATIESVTFPRLHWGVAALGGPYFFNGGDGGLGGISGRLGLQITPRFSMVAQLTTVVGGGVTVFSDDMRTTISTEVLAAGMLAGNAEVDFDYFYIGLGPEVVLAAAAGPTSTSGAFFGIDARVGLWAPRPQSPRSRRAGLQLGVDVHAIIMPAGVILTPLITVGWEAF